MCGWPARGVLTLACLRRATGDADYLDDAKAFFGAYQSSKESDQQLNMLVDWNNNFWSTAVLLASITDLEAYHYQAQSFLGNWVCSNTDVVTYTKEGRAWNSNKGAHCAFVAGFLGVLHGVREHLINT